MSKIYLAARYSRNAEMRGHRDELVAMGHAVTSRWIDCHPDVVGDFSESFTQEALNARPELCAPLGQHDIDDLTAADTVISFTGQGGKGGRHVEFGYAAALGKGLIVVGARENIFHALPQVQHFADWAAALTALGGMAEPERAHPLGGGHPRGGDIDEPAPEGAIRPGDQRLRDRLADALCVDHGHSRQEGGAKCRSCARRADAAMLVVFPLLAAKDAEIEQLRGDDGGLRAEIDELADLARTREWDLVEARSALEEALGQLDIIRFALGVPSGGAE